MVMLGGMFSFIFFFIAAFSASDVHIGISLALAGE